jgi:hypothetical protein
MSFWLRELTVESLLKAASEFEGERIEAAGLSGPVIGDKIEQVFLGRLEGQDFDIGRNVKRVAGRPDLPNLNCDIKALQLRGRRGRVSEDPRVQQGREATELRHACPDVLIRWRSH